MCTCTGEGTPPTEEMVTELAAAGVSEIRIVYDNDPSGRDGAIKAQHALVKGGIKARVGSKGAGPA